MNHPYPAHVTSVWHRWGPRITVIACAAAFVNTAYRAFEALNVQPPASVQETDSAQAISAIQSILDANLFNEEAEGNFRDTTALLELRGTFAGTDGAPSYAIVALGDQEKSYRLGSMLPGGIEITAIFVDHIVIREHNGRYRTVRLQEKTNP